MKRLISEETRKKFTVDTSLIELIDEFKNIVDSVNLPNQEVIFESLPMIEPDHTKNYFQFSIYINSYEGDDNFQIRLDLQYPIRPIFYILKNIIFLERDNNFWERIKNSNAVKYIVNENVKPISIALLELEI